MTRQAAALLVAASGVTADAAAAQLTATFAGGCFWCVEADFDKVPGVLATTSGYTGGRTPNPNYEQVSGGDTGHLEALQVTYDPAKTTYAQLLTVFWHSIDPTDPGGQFCDRGEPYQTAVFVGDDAQRQLAEESRAAAMQSLGKDIVTPVRAAADFYPAEAYHQDYYKKNPLRYKLYRWNCRRDQRVRKLWGDKAYTGIPGK